MYKYSSLLVVLYTNKVILVDDGILRISTGCTLPLFLVAQYVLFSNLTVATTEYMH